MAGYSGTPLWKKLGMKPDTVWVLFDAPQGFVVEEAPAPLVDLEELTDFFDGALAFCTTKEAVQQALSTAKSKMTAHGGLWICWPKKSSRLDSNIGQMDVMQLGIESGFVDNKVCAIDEDWSGLRFVVRKENRADWPVRHD